MKKKQQELLERVLLLMKYDNKETLSENISKVKILTEQPDPNKIPKNQYDKDAIKNCKTQPRNYDWFAPRTKETVDKFCNSLQLNYPSFYSKTPVTNNPNPQTTPKPKVLKKEELRKYSIEQLIKLYESNTVDGEARVSINTNKDNIITVFAEKISEMNYDDLIKLLKNNKVFRDSLYFSDSPTGSSIQQPRSKKSFKGNVKVLGPFVVLLDYEIFERKIGEYNKNPKQFKYQPPIEPNWKDLTSKFPSLTYLTQYQYSPTQYLTNIKQKEQGLVGYTQKGYPMYGDIYLTIQQALVVLGYLKEEDISQKYTVGFHHSWYNSLRKYLQSNDYKFGEFLGTTKDNPDRMNIIEDYICMLKYQNGNKVRKGCEGSDVDWLVIPIERSLVADISIESLILSFLEANAYPNIPPDNVLFNKSLIGGKGVPEDDSKKIFEQDVKDSKFLKISIYDVNGKIIPLYTRGDDPDLPTYSLESEGFELPPQTIFLGPVFSILTDEQVKTLVDWLSEWCTEPVEVNGVKYGRKIITGGGSSLNFDSDLVSKFPEFMREMMGNQSLYPNCVVDFANKETNGDVGKWMIKFLKLPEDQIDLLLQFYPEDYNLIQTYLPGAPGSKDFYLDNPLVKNAVKMHIFKSVGHPSWDDITDSMIESEIKELLEDCPGMHKELQAIAAGKREYNGYIVGQYYSALLTAGYHGYTRYQIPCPDEWWDENGWKIVVGGVLLASFIFPPLFLAAGWELELAIVARMSVDIGLNLYSAYRRKAAGDEEGAKIDLACAMLAFIVDTPAFEKKFLSGYGSFPEVSVFKRLKDANPNNAVKMKNFVSSLSDVERRHLYEILNSTRLMRHVQLYGKEILDRWLKQQFGSQWKNAAIKFLREIGVKLPIAFSPIMLNFGYKMFIYANQVSQNIFKVPLDETKWRAFEWAMKKNGVTTEEQANEFFERLMGDVELQRKFIKDAGKEIFGEQFKEIEKQITPSQLKKQSEEAKSLIKQMKEANKQIEAEVEN